MVFLSLLFLSASFNLIWNTLLITFQHPSNQTTSQRMEREQWSHTLSLPPLASLFLSPLSLLHCLSISSISSLPLLSHLSLLLLLFVFRLFHTCPCSSPWTHWPCPAALGRKSCALLPSSSFPSLLAREGGQHIMRVHVRRLLLRIVLVVALLVAGGKLYQRHVAGGPAPSGSAVRRDVRKYPGATPTRMHGILGRQPDGTPGYVPKPCPKDYNMAAELRNNGFFGRLSDCLPLDRNITDGRHPECRRVQYDLDDLPTTSVIFVFYNEWFSVLLRSIHSVLNRTPPQLLQEIILVDDGSDKPWLLGPLEEYVRLLPKVKLVRNAQRSGLVKARLRGIQESTADTFTVLDSHIEVEEGWCEPLMARIRGDRYRVLMPQIDGINQEVSCVCVANVGE